MEKYITLKLSDVLPDPFATGRGIDYTTPQGLVEAILYIEEKYPDYEYCHIVRQKYPSDDFVLLKLK